MHFWEVGIRKWELSSAGLGDCEADRGGHNQLRMPNYVVGDGNWEVSSAGGGVCEADGGGHNQEVEKKISPHT